MATYDEYKDCLLQYINTTIVTNALEFIKTSMEYMENYHYDIPGITRAEIISLIVQDIVSASLMSKTYSSVPPQILLGLRKLVESNLILPTISIISEASKGKLFINKPMMKCSHIFPCCK